MYRIGVAIICLILGIGAVFYLNSRKNSMTLSSQHFSTWKEFTPVSGLFKVLLPYSPQYAKDFVTLPDSHQQLRYDMYASEKIDGTLFLINVVTYPTGTDLSISDDLLYQTLDELIRSKPDNKLLKSEKSFFLEKSTLSFSSENKNFHIEGKILIDSNRVYVLTYTTRKQDFDLAEYQYFIDSFKLNNRMNDSVNSPSLNKA